jgi:hypothetical protein
MLLATPGSLQQVRTWGQFFKTCEGANFAPRCPLPHAK